jgi:1,4-dihydroxy-2-naphthoyl-CoA hydrolase
MTIWNGEISLEMLQQISQPTMIAHLGIKFTEVGSDFLKAKMPVDYRTTQPAGLLHGGASAALAETLGSFGSYLTIDRNKFDCVGIEINAHHLRAVKNGFVEGTVRPLKLGRRLHVWEIEIYDEQNLLVCKSSITLAIIEKTPKL